MQQIHLNRAETQPLKLSKLLYRHEVTGEIENYVEKAYIYGNVNESGALFNLTLNGWKQAEPSDN